MAGITGRPSTLDEIKIPDRGQFKGAGMKKNSGRKYRPFLVKLMLSFVLISVSGCFLSSFIIFKISEKMQLENIKSKLLSTAKVASNFIDGDEFDKLAKRGGRTSPEYEKIKKILKRVQKDQDDIKFIYTMVDTNKKGIVKFIVDPQEAKDENGNGIIDAGEKGADFGEFYDAESSGPCLLEGFERPTTSDDIAKDKWGSFMSGFAPLYNSEKKSVGLVGVDMAIERVTYLKEIFQKQSLIVFSFVIFGSVLISFMIAFWINRPLKIIHKGIEEVAKGNLNVKVEIDTNDEFKMLGDSFNEMTKALKEKDLIKNAFVRYFSNHVANEILKDPEKALLKTQRKRVTILFSDLAGFTSFSEKLPPEKVVEILNIYFSKMIDIVFKYEGTIDKFIGDGMMVLFGTPLEMHNQEENAVRVALEMQKEMKELVAQNLDFGCLRTRIGINTGTVVVGNIGSNQRMEYTVIGDEVNMASRLEAYNKELHSEILVSSSTYHPIKHIFDANKVENISIRGIEEKQTVYIINGLKVSATTEEK